VFYPYDLDQRFPYFLRPGALFRSEIRHGALSSPFYQRHVCAYLDFFLHNCIFKSLVFYRTARARIIFRILNSLLMTAVLTMEGI